MWKNIKFKKGALSILLILGLVLTNLSPLGAWAEEATEAAVEALDVSGQPEVTAADNDLAAKKAELLKNFDNRPALEDVTERLQDIKGTVVQDGKVVQTGSDIVTGKDIEITIEFKVPVKGDLKQDLVKAKTPEDLAKIDINKYIKAGDKAKLILSKGIKLKEGVTSYTDTLKDKDGNKIGEGTFEKEGNDGIVFKIAFAGDDKNLIYDGSRYNVGVQGGTDFSLDTSNLPSNPDQDTLIQILDKKYTIKNTYDKVTAIKSGVVNYTDNGKHSYDKKPNLSWDELIGEDKTGSGKISITWTVEVSRTDINGNPVNLDGYKFADNLTGVGGYIAGTFYVDNDNVADSLLSYKDNKLSYVFPAGTGPKAVIKFNTALKNSEFRSGVTKKNTAKILNPKDGEVASAYAEVNWTVNWGKKEAKAPKEDKDESGRVKKFYIKDGKYYIDWIIEFNRKGFTLDNVRLVDDLQSTMNGKYKLEFVSGKWEPLSGGESPVQITSDKISSEKFGPNDERRVYKIGNIDKPIKVTITSEVKKVVNNSPVDLKAEDLKERIRFSNWAVMLWGTDYNTTFWTEAYIGPGSFITKKAITNEKDKGYSGLSNVWKIKVPAKSVGDSTYVYDAFIFNVKDAPSFTDLKKSADGKLIVKDSNGNPASLQSRVDVRDLVPTHVRYNKYIDNLFSVLSSAKLQRKVYKLYYDGKYIGDVVEVWGFSKNEENVFTLKSIMTGPQFILTKKAEESNYNIAHIVDNDLILDNAYDWPLYKTRMLQKQALTAASAGKIIDGDTSTELVNTNVYKVNEGDFAANVNNTAKRAINNKSVAYNKEKNSIIYRISVNAAGISGVTDYTGKFLLTDELDDKDWKFVPIREGGPDYLIYEGSSYSEAYSDDAVVKAENGPLKDLSFLDLSKTKIEGKTANFLFNKLDKPYVILLRATTVSDDTLVNKFGALYNTATLKFNSYGNNSVTSTQNVDYNRGVLSKTYNDENISKHYIIWTIGYEPYKFKNPDKAVYLEDELGEGLKIRRNEDKTLAFDGGNYQMLEGRLENGQFVQEQVITTETLRTLLSYDDNKSVLTINIPNRKKVYRFIYVTDVVGKTAGEKVNNKVKLMEGGSTTHIEAPKEYKIAKAYMSGSSESFPVFTIYKTNEDGTAGLEKAKFTIKGGNTDLEVETNKEGKVTTNTLPFTTYTVKETVAPADYELKDNDVEFKVKINKLDGGKVQISLVDNYNPLVTIQDDVITVKNTKNRAGFKIVKASSDDKDKTKLADITRLKGAQFALTRVGSTKPEPVVNNDNGEFEFKNLIAGVYDLEEKVVPANHKGIAKNTYRILVDPTKNDGEKISVLKRNGSQYMPLTANDTEIKEFGNTFVVFNDRTKPDTAEFKLIKTDLAYKGANSLADIKAHLNGAEFTLISEIGNGGIYANPVVTGEDGTIVFKNLNAGTYTLKETKAPTGYAILAKEYKVTVTPGAVPEIAIQDANPNQIKLIDNTVVVFNEKLMDLDLFKADLADKDKNLNDMLVLGGAKFKLTSVSDATASYEATTATDGAIKGKLTFKNLKAGTYTLAETEAPTGYAILAKPYEITVTPSAVNPEVAIKDADSNQIKLVDNTVVVFNEKLFDLKLIKADLTDKNAVSSGAVKTRLSGAEFKLVSANNVEYIGKSNGQGIVEFEELKGLKTGTYTLEETKAPDGYNSLMKPYTIEVTASATNPNVVIKDADANQIKKLKDGEIVVFNEQKENSFNLKLIKAALADRSALTEADIKYPLNGAEFRLELKSNPETVSKTAITTAGGILTFNGLDGGVYTLKETKAPAGYASLMDEYEITVTPGAVSGTRVAIKDADRNQIKRIGDTVVVFNEKTYDLNLLKADFDVNKDIVTKGGVTLGAIKTPLNGAKFRLALASNAAVSYSAVTGENGSAKFAGLKSGTYVLTEEAAPDNYTALMKSYTVVVTASALNPELNIIDAKDEEIKEIEKTVVVFNKKTPYTPSPSPDPDPTPGPSPSPDPSPNPNPNPNPPTPTTDLPRYPENNFPDPNDPGSPDEFVAVDDDGTPQGKYVKSKKPDGTNEYIPVDEDGTPLGVNKAKKKLPKTGGSDTTVYYAGGAILLILAAGVVVFRRKKYNR